MKKLVNSNKKCKKCDLDLDCLPGSKHEYGKLRGTFDGKDYISEWILRTCNRCGYEWYEDVYNKEITK